METLALIGIGIGSVAVVSTLTRLSMVLMFVLLPEPRKQ